MIPGVKLEGCSHPDEPMCCVPDENGLIDCKFCEGSGWWTPTLTCELCAGSGRMPWPYEMDYAAQRRLAVRAIEAQS